MSRNLHNANYAATTEGWSVLVTATQVVSLFIAVMFLDPYLTLADAVLKQNYVIPIRGIQHLTDQAQFCTLEEYAIHQLEDQYFVNDTIFYLYPGIHTLNRNLYVKNVHNLTIQGLFGSEPVVLVPGSLIRIIWENCWCIKISSVDFHLADNFTHSIIFNLTQSVQLSNLSIFGNGSNGCSSILSQESVLEIINSKFVGIKGLKGSALMISDFSVVNFTGNNRFESNTAISGGAIFLHNSELTFNGRTLLINNTASIQNGSIMNGTLCYPPLSEIRVHEGGGAIASHSSTLIINNSFCFIQNVAGLGGAIHAVYGKMEIRGAALFNSPRNTSDNICGGAINLNQATSEFNANCISFLNNKASYGGAINLIQRKPVQILATSLMCVRGKLIQVMTTSFFKHKNVANQSGGAIKSLDSNIKVSGALCFILNNATLGGAITLEGTSKLILTPVLAISFTMNHASDSGGALYIDDDYDNQCYESISASDCFFSVETKSSYPSIVNISFLFINNSAANGSTLYGGELNKCKLCHETIITNELRGCYYSYDALEMFMNFSLTSIYLDDSSVNNISSPPQTLHHCQSDIWNSYGMDVYLGQVISVTLKATGQVGSSVNATILFFSNSEYYVSPKQQHIGYSCTNASFYLYSNKNVDVKSDGVTVDLYFSNPCQRLDLISPELRLKLNILSCPLGFALSKKDTICACEEYLSKFVQNCYIDSLSFEHNMQNTFWVSKESDSTVILHEFRCPLDYCTVDLVNVTLNISDVQCNFNRTGTLCGRCQKHYSLALGSLHCLLCGNHHIALIIPFALAGVLLVTITLLLRLTVAVGTLNGLLFYANIIQANHQAFFPKATINFFTIFISWLNLDLGIEICFYDGMDVYAYSWLQFLFPFYVWFLIGCIILVSHYFQSFARSLGQNPVAVLATLLLMSFSKILGTIISPLSWTFLTYYNSTHETHRIVWLYDGSLDFFKEPKHTVLGVFAISIVIVFILPYVLLLTFAQWLQACSNWRALLWLNNLKPLIDAYHAPYKRHTRYQTGLLLLTRMGLFLTFAINTLGSENINILAVSSVTIVLLAMQVGSVYEHWWNDMLECSFLLNLGIFSVATFYIKEEIEHDKRDKSQLILSSISVGAAFATCFGIILFHIYFVIKSTSFWKVHMYPCIHKNNLLTRMLRTTTEGENDATLQENTEIHAIPTSTIVDVDLREPLIDVTCH